MNSPAIPLSSSGNPLYNICSNVRTHDVYTLIAIIMHSLHGLCYAPGPQLLGAVAPADTSYFPALSGCGLSYPVVIAGQSAAAVSAELAEEAGEECPAGGARGRDVDHRVPEAHEGEDDACCVGVRNGDGFGVDE